MEGITKQQFFEAHENEHDIAKVMTDYKKEFNERLTTNIYQHFLYYSIEEKEDEIQ